MGHCLEGATSRGVPWGWVGGEGEVEAAHLVWLEVGLHAQTIVAHTSHGRPPIVIRLVHLHEEEDKGIARRAALGTRRGVREAGWCRVGRAAVQDRPESRPVRHARRQTSQRGAGVVEKVGGNSKKQPKNLLEGMLHVKHRKTASIATNPVTSQNMSRGAVCTRDMTRAKSKNVDIWPRGVSISVPQHEPVNQLLRWLPSVLRSSN